MTIIMPSNDYNCDNVVDDNIGGGDADDDDDDNEDSRTTTPWTITPG